jgi:hypothetical protein
MATRSAAPRRSADTQETKHSENNAAGNAFITSLSVSCEGTPRSNGRKRRRKSSFRFDQRSMSAKSSAPAIVPHSTISRISGNG